MAATRTVLDTTVLVARPIHQLLGTLGTDGLFDVVWSDALLSELVDVLTRPVKEGGRDWPVAAARAVAGYVRSGFPSGEVAPDVLAEHLMAAGELVNDPGDAHVVALALAARAATLVTANTGDYVTQDLLAAGIEVVPPDALLMRLYTELPDDVTLGVERQVAGRHLYPTSTHDILSLLYRAGCSAFAARLCSDLGLPRPSPHRHLEASM